MDNNTKEFEQLLKGWIKDVKDGKISQADLNRSIAYAKDLGQGLRIVHTYPQGVAIFGSARVPETEYFYKKARELGGILAQNGHTVITGGGPGIMEAANRGAFEYGGRSIGLNIVLPHEQHINPHLTDTLEFRYFFARKVMLAMSAKVYVYFPGGFGTLDELSEILVLVQEGKMPKMPIFFFGKSYWKPLDKFFQTRLLKSKMIKPGDIHVYKITDNVKDILNAANRIGHPKIGENFYDRFDNLQNKAPFPSHN